MADALRNSFVVLVCATQGYQDSPNCKRELSLALDKNKPIVPIKLGSFEAEGFLDTATAGKFYCTIQSVDEVEQWLPKIIEEIENSRGNAVGARPANPDDTDSRPTAAAANGVRVTEEQLHALADNFPADGGVYKKFAGLLKINNNQADNIFATCHHNQREAVRACLFQYRDDTGACKDELLTCLDKVKLSYLHKYIE